MKRSAPPHKLGTNSVAILDAGAQYGKVIDRRVRHLLVHCDLLPLNTPYEALKKYAAFIISGGPESVYDRNAPMPDPKIFTSKKPILGICYGMQLINQAFGGSVEKKLTREDGQFDITTDPSSPLFDGLDGNQDVLLTHGDSLGRIADGFKAVATSGEIVAAIADKTRRMYGVQFHPEVDLTSSGQAMLANFLFKVAKLKPSYTLEDRLQTALDYIRATVGDRQVLSFASGGVDSTVCSVLLGMALPAAQLQIVHIDTGFMRRGESAAVKKALKTVDVDVMVIDAKQQFYSATTTLGGKQTTPLCQTTDPEIKRSIIGDTFIKVMDQVVASLELDPQTTILAQGTLRPDLIESASSLASSKAAVIKTHHNDTALVRQLRARGLVIEPLKELHKDEVRSIGEKLKLPRELVWRQPFPGPGLAIRLLCAERPYITKRFDTLSAELRAFENDDIAAHLLPVRTVGVQGDGRSYSYAVALSGKPDWPRLMRIARDIPKQLHDVNRVVYVFGDKLSQPVVDITPTFPTPKAIGQLRLADWHVNEVLRTYKLLERLSQVPVVSFPVHFGEAGKRSIAIRTFITNDFMTGVPAVPGIDIPEPALDEMVARLLSVPNVARVAYDLTAKPPGTTEWE